MLAFLKRVVSAIAHLLCILLHRYDVEHRNDEEQNDSGERSDK